METAIPLTQIPTKAVILARGLGTRMRSVSPLTNLTAEQERIADAGTKTLIPIARGITLLDLIVANLREAGFSEICLVIGPEHEAIRRYCAAAGLGVQFAIQNEAKGTSDAVAAAEFLAGGDELFLVVNSDNLYPTKCLSLLRDAGRPAMLAFERAALIERSNIPEERIAKFAVVEIDENGNLSSIQEKPENVQSDAFVSMNAWLFSNKIFEACRAIERSERGEYELTTAVRYAVDNFGLEIAAIKTREGVLDLSSRSDIESIARFLPQL